MITARVAKRRVRRQLVLFGVVVAICASLLAASNTGPALELRGAVQYAFEPVTSTLNNIADAVGSIWSAIADIDHLRSDNDRLRAENEALKNELSRVPEVALLNNDWTAITQAQKLVPSETTPATVLIRDLSPQARTYTIDKGTDAGLKTGLVVIAAGGALVGRITWVGPSTAQVQLINDVNSVVTGKAIDPANAQTSASGEVVGQVGGLLEMQNVDATETLTKGEQVVTAGYSLGDIRSPFPPALLIGQVVDVSRDANAVVQTAYLEPACDFDHTQYVLVITNYEGGLLAEPTPGPSGSGVASPGPSRSPKSSAVPSAGH